MKKSKITVMLTRPNFYGLSVMVLTAFHSYIVNITQVLPLSYKIPIRIQQIVRHITTGQVL